MMTTCWGIKLLMFEPWVGDTSYTNHSVCVPWESFSPRMRYRLSAASRRGVDPSPSQVLATKPALCNTFFQTETFLPGGKQDAKEKSQGWGKFRSQQGSRAGKITRLKRPLSAVLLAVNNRQGRGHSSMELPAGWTESSTDMGFYELPSLWGRL